VLNAGISEAAPIADYTVEDFDNLFATNVRSPFFLVQQLLPILGEGSNIIVISSIGANKLFLRGIRRSQSMVSAVYMTLGARPWS
jgi:NAD(P)-dependent dehydrogenase (short-subunit alcohol dehydrogenase family)